MTSVAIIGAGRMGQGLGLALHRKGVPVTLLGRHARPVATPLALEVTDWTAGIGGAGIVIIAAPDNVVRTVAERLEGLGVIRSRHVVLHVAGPLDRTALGALQASGAALGSFHPLQTVADPLRAPERLAGAYAGLEGDDRAVAAGLDLARTLAMQPFRIPTGAKARYHAAAVLAANYTVTLMGVAERLAREAGIEGEVAGRMFVPLLLGAAANVDAMGPTRALTGPVRRGDTETVALHLAALAGADRQLYAELGLATLALAREGGLDREAGLELERALRS